MLTVSRCMWESCDKLWVVRTKPINRGVVTARNVINYLVYMYDRIHGTINHMCFQCSLKQISCKWENCQQNLCSPCDRYVINNSQKITTWRYTSQTRIFSGEGYELVFCHQCNAACSSIVLSGQNKPICENGKYSHKLTTYTTTQKRNQWAMNWGTALINQYNSKLSYNTNWILCEPNGWLSGSCVSSWVIFQWMWGWCALILRWTSRRLAWHPFAFGKRLDDDASLIPKFQEWHDEKELKI